MSDFDPTISLTPSGSDIPASPAPSDIPGAPTPTGVPAIPQDTNAPANAIAGPHGTPEGHVPSWRLRQVSEQLRQTRAEMQALQEYRQKAEDYERKLHALVGVQTPNQNPRIDSIRNEFGQIYPGLSKLEEKVETLLKLAERAGDYDQQLDHYWASHGQTTMDRLYTEAERTMGQPLSEMGKYVLHSAFTGFVQSNPEAADRYVRDPRFVGEFWKAFSSNFIDPVRRTQAAQVQQRVPQAIPRDTPGAAVPVTQAPKPASLEERVSQAWNVYNSQKG